MMLHMSKEECDLFDQMDKTDDIKEIAEIKAKLKEIWEKEDEKYKDLPFD